MAKPEYLCLNLGCPFNEASVCTSGEYERCQAEGLWNSKNVYIVDWDIPTETRRMFYYHLNKIKTRREISGSMSSMSVMVVSDRDLALEVFSLASKYGRSSIYEGTLLDSSHYRDPDLDYEGEEGSEKDVARV